MSLRRSRRRWINKGGKMRATVQDAYNSLTLRNVLIILGIVMLSVVLIDLVGYVVWRRFPIPTLIICVAALGWKIGRKIGHAGLSKVTNAASVGLGIFGVVHWISAVIDGAYFPVMGYVSWTTHVTMWAWIAFHVWRAWRVLKQMPPDHLMHVTEGTEAIYAQMTYREARAREVLQDYEKAKKLQFAAA